MTICEKSCIFARRKGCISTAVFARADHTTKHENLFRKVMESTLN